MSSHDDPSGSIAVPDGPGRWSDSGPVLHVLAGPDGVLRVLGEVDSATVRSLGDALAAAGDTVEVDLSGCSFFGSAGVSVLVTAKTGHAPGLRVVNPSAAVRSVLAICGLEELLVHEPS